MESIEVQDVRVPALGFGTWQLRGDACREGVRHALELGYRHTDTARMYRNEAEVGAGIAYSPLPTGGLVGDDVLQEIGGRHGKSAEQVAIRWLLDQDLVAPIPRPSDPEHREENLDVFDFTLDAGERQRIAGLGR